MDQATWHAKYLRLRAIADRINAMRHAKARRLCAAAGLDPQLLGIHPHNAMCGFHAGKPWPGINYSLVRACLRELDRQWEPYRIVEKWDKRVRNY